MLHRTNVAATDNIYIQGHRAPRALGDNTSLLSRLGGNREAEFAVDAIVIPALRTPIPLLLNRVPTAYFSLKTLSTRGRTCRKDDLVFQKASEQKTVC
jgi:hypothetical protein